MLGKHIRFMAQANKQAAAEKERNYGSNAFSFTDAAALSIFQGMYTTPNNYHKMFSGKWYLILCQIQDDTVYTEYILGCRKD